MILLVDSGATNSTWKFMSNEDDSLVCRMKGINLSTSNLAEIKLSFEDGLQARVKSIFFFGAGVGHKEKEEELKAILRNYFINVEQITIGSDLNSAGLALSNGERCIVSILGTGSNCCIFEKSKITMNMNNLGFILGDEGSGYSMGREILRRYFYGTMSSADHELFNDKYQLSRDTLIKKVYHTSSKPNTYIASYCAFLSFSSPELRKEIVFSSLSSFFRYQLEQFEELKELPCHFSGSISWYFQNEIKEICRKHGYKVGKIIQNPIDSLTYSILSNQ